MKRNKPPVAEDELVEQARIIENRLENLFSVAEVERRICVSNKGYWIPQSRHVRLDSARPSIAAHFLCYSSELDYHYLNALHALYCLESSQLLVFHRNLPLSLAEAYQLLISNQEQFAEYLVLQRLTRAGFICLRPQVAALPPDEPQPSIVISFEVYRKETYRERKPQQASNRRDRNQSKRPSSKGRPDYLIVSVRMSCSNEMSSIKQLLYLDELSSKRGTAAQIVADEASAATTESRDTPTSGTAEPAHCCDNMTKPEIIFALVDDDNSVCFTRCAPMAMTFN